MVLSGRKEMEDLEELHHAKDKERTRRMEGDSRGGRNDKQMGEWTVKCLEKEK
jgi:hypothetical protein